MDKRERNDETTAPPASTTKETTSDAPQAADDSKVTETPQTEPARTPEPVGSEK